MEEIRPNRKQRSGKGRRAAKSPLVRFLYVARNLHSRRLFAALNDHVRGDVLDVGGWDFFETAKKRGLHFDTWTTLEYSTSRGAQSVGGDHELVIGDGCRMPFQKGCFDAVLNIQVLEHVLEPLRMVSEIERVLRREHGIPPGRDNDFRIMDRSEFLETFEETTRTFTFLLGGIAAVSLLVGGIGIMNIMLVSVTERTREIGVRKALGATRKNIMLQFLVEALVLCLLGGLIGVAAGAGGAVALSRLANWNTFVSPQSVAVAVAFSAMVGIFFGLWPARRASLLDPIEALRYE